jgi:hypothetical protein
MTEKVSHISVGIFGDYSGKFGYKVFATNPDERDFVLSCSSRMMRHKELGDVYFLWKEIEDSEGDVVYRSEPVSIAKSSEEAGSKCFVYAKNTLGDILGRYMCEGGNLVEMVK